MVVQPILLHRPPFYSCAIPTVSSHEGTCRHFTHVPYPQSVHTRGRVAILLMCHTHSQFTRGDVSPFYSCAIPTVSSHEGTCRCNISLGHVPAAYANAVILSPLHIPATRSCPSVYMRFYRCSVCLRFVPATKY